MQKKEIVHFTTTVLLIYYIQNQEIKLLQNYENCSTENLNVF